MSVGSFLFLKEQIKGIINVFASRGLCLIVDHLFLSRTFADKDTFTVLPE